MGQQIEIRNGIGEGMVDIDQRRAYQRAYYKKRKERDGSYYGESRRNYYESNKESYATRSQEWYSNPENKRRVREKKFGIKFEDLIAKQGNKCGICGTEFTDYSKVHIDHDHETGYVRGLLCRDHNRGLGFFNDDWELLEKAAQWIFNGKVGYLNGN